MKLSKAEQKQIENEMIFRRVNEKTGTDLDALDAMHKKDGNNALKWNDDFLLQFRCECSDESCDKRIQLKLSEFRKIHKERNTFIVLADHQVESIEEVISVNEGYNVVKKNNSTPEPNDTLKKTHVDNS